MKMGELMGKSEGIYLYLTENSSQLIKGCFFVIYNNKIERLAH